jgi:transposase
MPTMQRRRYSKEFKEDAVAMVLRGEGPIKAIADQLGLHQSVLARWRREHLDTLDAKSKGSGSGIKPSDMDAENQRLRRELAEMSEQRDILKKAVGIFSRQPDRYTDS